MPASTFTADFYGFWTEEYSLCLPSVSGIYGVYEAYYDKKNNITNPLKLLAIGEADNIRDTVAALLPVSGWQEALKKDTILCFNYAEAEPEDRLRVAGALINHHKPMFNTAYKNEYPFGPTSVRTRGQAPFLSKSITVNRQELKSRKP